MSQTFDVAVPFDHHTSPNGPFQGAILEQGLTVRLVRLFGPFGTGAAGIVLDQTQDGIRVALQEQDGPVWVGDCFEVALPGQAATTLFHRRAEVCDVSEVTFAGRRRCCLDLWFSSGEEQQASSSGRAA
jgi:hypothetical protein